MKLNTNEFIEIIQYLDFNDSVALCHALNISLELAFQHHHVKSANSLFKSQLARLRYVALMLKATDQLLDMLNDVQMKDIDESLVFEVFLEAVDSGLVKVVEAFLSKLDPSSKDNEALIFAAGGGHYEILKLLLKDKRVDPNARDNEPIFYACEEGHVDIVRILLDDERIDPIEQGNFVLEHAIASKDYEMVRMVLGHPRFDRKREDINQILESFELDSEGSNILK